MNVRNVFLLTAFVATCATISAQTQPGYIKTLGRPNQKGQPLSGVTIRVKGAHNAVVSKADGTFSMMLPVRQQGDKYVLQQVQKNGYELRDKGCVGRSYAYSYKVPLTLVMVSRQSMQQEKQRIENSIYSSVERRYLENIAQLEQRHSANKIKAEQYSQQIQQLQKSFENMHVSVEALANHYVMVDYDNLDATEREITRCIEQGELERAYELIRQDEFLKQLGNTLQAKESAEQLRQEALASQADVLRQQEHDGRMLYNLYVCALGRFQNDSARYYIETRAELDTTNVEWQREAADYIANYWSDFANAIQYYQRAIRQSTAMYGAEHPTTIRCYDELSGLFVMLNEMTSAMTCYDKADESLKAHQADDDYLEALAVHYATYAHILYRRLDFPQTITYYQKALQLMQQKYGDDHKRVADYYMTLGGAYNWNYKYEEALTQFSKALSIYEKNNSPLMQRYTLQFTIASTYVALGKRQEGLRSLLESLDILKKACGTENNYAIASVYKSLGIVYTQLRDFDQALTYADRLIAVKRQLFGDKHPEVIEAYQNKGNILIEKSETDKGIELLMLALSLKERLYPANHVEIAGSYSAIGVARISQKKYDEGRAMLKKAANIYQQSEQSAANQYHLAVVYNNLGSSYTMEEVDCAPAEQYFSDALTIKKRLFGENHSEVGITYREMANMYDKMGDYQKALDYYEKTLQIELNVSGGESRMVGFLYKWMGLVCIKQNEFQSALNYMEKAYPVYIKIYGKDNEGTKAILELIGDLKKKL